jgi:hypothetical protein
MSIELWEFNFLNCWANSYRSKKNGRVIKRLFDKWLHILRHPLEMAKSIVDVLAPLNFISKFCGYSIFTINRVDFSIAFERIDVLLQIWIVIVNCFLSFHLWDASQNFPLHKSDIISKSMPIILCGSFGLYIFCLIASLLLRKKQSILMKLICQIDGMVRHFRDYQT